MIVRSAIQEIALEHRRRYGYRRVTAELRRRGMMVNHKQVARMMRADNLLEIQKREVLLATDRNDEMEIYLNLASRVKVCRPNQDRGYNLCSTEGRVRLLGGGPRCLLPQGGGMVRPTEPCSLDFHSVRYKRRLRIDNRLLDSFTTPTEVCNTLAKVTSGCFGITR